MDEIERALDTLDEETATTARPVVESLLGHDDTRVPLATLTQSEYVRLGAVARKAGMSAD